MKIKIEDIGIEGRRVDEDLDGEGVGAILAPAALEVFEGIDGREGGKTFARVHVEATRVDRTVFLRGAIEGRFWTPCSRCLGPAPIDVNEPELRLTYLPPEMARDEDGEKGDVELDLEDLDTFVHDGDTIDLANLLREYFTLALPIAPLCREDCTGVDRGIAEAPLAEEGPDTPWKDALQKLREQVSEAPRRGKQKETEKQRDR